jgi:bacillithiol biosynthesis cysteine-adding enzyme BshC
MQRIALPYRATGRFSPLVCDLLDDAPALAEHRVFRPDLAGLKAAAAQRRFDPAMRIALGAVLRRQCEGMRVHPAVAANLEALRRDDALTVTTGHQLCLFTGPLYVPFKLLNAVRLARTLTQELGRPVVPVFWMATEDHDRAEIDHAWLGAHKVHWPGEAGGPVGRLALDGIGPVLDAVAQQLGTGEEAARLVALLRECYRPERTLTEATRRFVDALFGRFGLVVLDADDPALKRAFVPVMREELLNEVTQRTVSYANERLAGPYGVQAHARAINVFHLRPGHRARIVQEEGRYRALDGGPTWTVDELLAEVELRPQDFSPNVLLRPVYQETILPNIAYIGGGGELAYWMQLRWLFQGLQVPMPAVLLRTSAAFLPAKLLRLWREEGLSVEDLFAPLEPLQARAAIAKAAFDTGVEEERARLNALYDALLARATAADPTLKGAVEAGRTRALQGLDHLGLRLVRAAKRQQRTTLDRMARVHEALFPGGGLQERRDNILPLLAARGEGLLDELLERLDPLDPHFSLLIED